MLAPVARPSWGGQPPNATTVYEAGKNQSRVTVSTLPPEAGRASLRVPVLARLHPPGPLLQRPDDGPDAPTSVLRVIKNPTAARNHLSVLTLAFEVVNERPDWPVVSILVDGTDPFAAVAPDWRGFDPESLPGPDSPLLPVDGGRRVAVCTCSCGEAGCGVIAPVIVASPDGRRVSWVDPRDYTGVFGQPLAASVGQHDGKPWDLPDLHFDREQYVAEVRRASEDRSWETARRQTARLLYELLKPEVPVLPPDLPLSWVSPSRSA